MNKRIPLLFVTLAALVLIGTTPALSQSLISGDIVGVVTDPQRRRRTEIDSQADWP